MVLPMVERERGGGDASDRVGDLWVGSLPAHQRKIDVSRGREITIS